jgi:hypothetical protein
MSDPFDGIDNIEDDQPSKPKSKKPKKSKKIILDDIIEPTPAKKQPKSNDYKEKATLIYAIKAYTRSKRFAKYLKSQGKTFSEVRLQKMTVEQLNLELETLDLTIADRGNSDFIDNLVKGGLLFSENIVNDRTKMKIAGTTNELFESDKFLDLLERVKLKYGLPSVKLDPALELLFLALTTGMACHQANSFNNGLINDDIDLDTECPIISTKTKKRNKD